MLLYFTLFTGLRYSYKYELILILGTKEDLKQGNKSTSLSSLFDLFIFISRLRLPARHKSFDWHP